ncbi:hypothetical protein M8C21_025549, partial [Ambrosia artemisiifolia]
KTRKLTTMQAIREKISNIRGFARLSPMPYTNNNRSGVDNQAVNKTGSKVTAWFRPGTPK